MANEFLVGRTLRTITTFGVYVVAIVIFYFFVYKTTPVGAQEKDVPVLNQAPTQTTETKSLVPVGYSVEQLTSPSDVIAKDFVVGPGKTELTIKPGESKTVDIIVSNRTGETRQFNFEIEDTAGSNNTNTPIVLLGNDRGPYTLKDYIKLPYMSIDLEHNQRARIPVTISVPLDAEPGGRYGSVLVTTVSKDVVRDEKGKAAASSAIISRLATLFFLTIPGDTYTEGLLQSLSTVPNKKLFTEGPINFQLLFENKGDLHLSPYGEIRITNFIGEEVGFVELDPWFAMPKSLRSREVEWNRDLLIGRYTATAHVNRGYDDKIDTASVTFWVLPWKIVAGTFAVLFTILLLLRFIVRNFEFKRKQ